MRCTHPIFMGLYLVMSFTIEAQSRVESMAFQLMLDGMLSDTIPVVSVAELKGLERVVLLDARANEEFKVSHLKNAVWVGHEEFDLSRIPKVEKEQVIVVYCSIGLRSEKIAVRLIDAGCQNVFNLYGGIFEWLNQEQKIYNDAGPTDNIHPYNFAWGLWLSEGEKRYE